MMAATRRMRTIPIFIKKGGGVGGVGANAFGDSGSVHPTGDIALKKWGETRLAPDTRSVVGFNPIVKFTSVVHIYGRLPGESIRLRPHLTSPASSLNPPLPLISNSEKKNAREAFAGLSLEAPSGYLGGVDAAVGQRSDLAEQFHQRDPAGIHEEAARECHAPAWSEALSKSSRDRERRRTSLSKFLPPMFSPKMNRGDRRSQPRLRT